MSSSDQSTQGGKKRKAPKSSGPTVATHGGIGPPMSPHSEDEEFDMDISRPFTSSPFQPIINTPMFDGQRRVMITSETRRRLEEDEGTSGGGAHQRQSLPPPPVTRNVSIGQSTHSGNLLERPSSRRRLNSESPVLITHANMADEEEQIQQSPYQSSNESTTNAGRVAAAHGNQLRTETRNVDIETIKSGQMMILHQLKEITERIDNAMQRKIVPALEDVIKGLGKIRELCNLAISPALERSNYLMDFFSYTFFGEPLTSITIEKFSNAVPHHMCKRPYLVIIEKAIVYLKENDVLTANIYHGMSTSVESFANSLRVDFCLLKDFINRAASNRSRTFTHVTNIEALASTPPIRGDVDGGGKESTQSRLLSDELYAAVSKFCLENQYRRSGERVYKQVITPEGHQTRFFKYHVTIVELVNHVSGDVVTAETAAELRYKRHIVNSIAERLKNTPENIKESSVSMFLPFIEPDGAYSSWRNGIYHTPTDTFWPYSYDEKPTSSIITNQSDIGKIPFNIVTINYHDINFRHMWNVDWRDIPCTSFDDIFRFQRFVLPTAVRAYERAAQKAKDYDVRRQNTATTDGSGYESTSSTTASPHPNQQQRGFQQPPSTTQQRPQFNDSPSSYGIGNRAFGTVPPNQPQSVPQTPTIGIQQQTPTQHTGIHTENATLLDISDKTMSSSNDEETSNNDQTATTPRRPHVSGITPSASNRRPILTFEDIDMENTTKHRRMIFKFKESAEFIYALLGRCFYPASQYDRWQICLFIIGYASTGKSLILSIISKYVPLEELGIIGNVTEEKFGLSGIISKRMVIVPEVMARWNWPQAEMLSCIANEAVEVKTKMQTKTTQIFGSHILMCGNEVCMTWRDVSGNLLRRFVIPHFTEYVPPAKVDPNLSEKLKESFDLIVQKLNRAYLDAVATMGNNRINMFLPQRLAESTRASISKTNPLSAFFNNTEFYTLHRDMKTKWTDFQEFFSDWYQTTQGNLRKINWNSDHWKPVFDQYGLEVRNEYIEETGRAVSYIYGMKLDDNHKAALRIHAMSMSNRGGNSSGGAADRGGNGFRGN